MKPIRTLTLLLSALAAASCGGKKESTNADITPEVQKVLRGDEEREGGALFPDQDRRRPAG